MSGSNNLTAGEKALSNAADKATTCKADLTKLYGNLSTQIDALQGKWGGQGAQAFQKLHIAWQEKQKTITKALDDFSQSLVETEKDNVATDQASADAANRNASRLG